MSNYEEARINLKRLAQFYKENEGNRNEATTRIQLIDCLFFECLGWSRQTDVEAEAAEVGEYADYIFHAPRHILIVEAKREGNYFELPAGENRIVYRIQSLCRDYPNLKSAIEQAMRYCQARGVPFGAVTNGHQVVAFVAVRTDGVSPLEGKALVFPTIDFMEAHFRELWDSLSKPGIQERKLQNKLLGDALPPIPPKLSASIYGYPGIKNRNVFQADLEIVSELVIEDVAKAVELEDQFLNECYCDSGALSQDSLVNRHILDARYSALFGTGSGGPVLSPAKTRNGVAPDILAKSISRRPILLIGDVGVGKSIFIRHLVRIDAREAFEKTINLYIDLGFGATLTRTIREYLLREIARQLDKNHGVDPDAANLIRGVYDLDLKKFSKGIYGALQNTDPAKFREKELEFLDTKLRQRDEHLRSVLDHISKARKKQVVIFIDNCDQRNDDVQQEAFLVAQEIAASWPATIFVTLRPETFYRSSREGALTGYHPKAFSIAPPRVDLVIQKRLTFGLKITGGEIPLSSLPDHTRATFSNLDSVIRVFLHTLAKSSWLRECLDNISGGNVRLALDLVKEFFGSGHVDTQKIVTIHREQGSYDIPAHEFLRAVVFGDCEYYSPEKSPVVNLFDVSFGDPKEHFVLPILLSLLASALRSAIDDGFLGTSKVYEQMQRLGFVPDQIDAAVVRAHRSKLLETSTRRASRLDQETPHALRLTTVGAYHIQRLAELFSYLDAIVVDTPIFDPTVRSNIHDVRTITERIRRVRVFKAYLDRQWQVFEGTDTLFPWPTLSRHVGEELVSIEQRICGGSQTHML